MPEERLVIIGGDAAGMSTAAQAKRLRAELDIIASAPAFPDPTRAAFTVCILWPPAELRQHRPGVHSDHGFPKIPMSDR